MSRSAHNQTKPRHLTQARTLPGEVRSHASINADKCIAEMRLHLSRILDKTSEPPVTKDTQQAACCSKDR